MIVILGPEEIEAMRRAGRAAAETLALVGARLAPGVTTSCIDAWVREDTARRGGRPSQLGHLGFPAAVCTSVNEVVCHGIPSDRVLEDGDIINVDVTTELGGFHGDCSATFAIGAVDPRIMALVDASVRARDAGVAAVRPGARLGDVGAAIEAVARGAGFGLVREFGGHGIGRRMHLPPHVPHVGPAGRGVRLREGMALTIEPMLTFGEPGLELLDDGWTVVTRDGSASAQFEHTLVVTRTGAEVLTDGPAGSGRRVQPVGVAPGRSVERLTSRGPGR